MANYKQIQALFDKYFQGGMDATEQAEFEIQLHNDPLLQGEFELQKDIVDSIRESRRMEIKQRLDQINVNTAQPLNLANVASSITVAAFVAVGALLYTNSFNQDKVISMNLEEATTISYMEPDMPKMPEVSLQRNEVEQQLIAEQTPRKPITELMPQADQNFEENKSIVTAPEIEVPDMPKNLEDVTTLDVVDDLANNAVGFESAKNSEIPSFKIENIKKEDLFHYQFFDGKLFLYGSFDNAPFDIIELKADGKRKVFLNHDQYYYYLNMKQKEVAPLIPLKDSTLINELNILKDEK